MSNRSPFDRKKSAKSRPITPRTRSSTRNKFEKSSSRTPSSQAGSKLASSRHRSSNSYGGSNPFSEYIVPDSLKKLIKEDPYKKNPRTPSIFNTKIGISQGLVGNRAFTPKCIGE